MAAIRLSGFRGAIKALHARLIPEANATTSLNVDPRSGDLRPWKQPAAVATCPSGTLTIYRMGRDVPNDALYWLTWPTRVSVIRGLNPTDTKERTIFTGDGVPQWTDNTIGLVTPPYPSSKRILGVPAPAGTPVITMNTDGPVTLTPSTINVVLTFVNDQGEEGSISAPSNKIVAHPGATIDVTNFPGIPAGNYGLTSYRIYCSAIGNSTATYAFAAEVPIGTITTTINTGALGAALETADYAMPPADGHHIVALWQFAAMLSKKSVRFCPLELIYAWPDKYTMNLQDPGVALGTFDQSLVVLTTGRPVLIQGQDPAGMSMQQISLDEACISAESVVSFEHGVAWASPDGLIYISGNGSQNLTDGVMNKEDWQALHPSTIVGEQYEGTYVGAYNDGTGWKGFVIDPKRPDGMFFLAAGYNVMHYDDVQDGLFLVAPTALTTIQKWLAGVASSTASFVSKVIRTGELSSSMTYGRVIADSYPQTVKFYADGVLRKTKVVTSDKVFRIRGGFSPAEWQISIDTSVPVQGLVLADNVNEAST